MSVSHPRTSVFSPRRAARNKNLATNFPDNVIRENQWGGVDIRRGGDPILKNNFICYGYSDGVVVGERGRGLIEGNHVYCMLIQLAKKSVSPLSG